jgi:hypothetical protein
MFVIVQKFPKPNDVFYFIYVVSWIKEVMDGQVISK